MCCPEKLVNGRAWRDHDEYVIPAAEVARIDRVNIEERRDLASLAGTA